jgi:hypothetical protein
VSVSHPIAAAVLCTLVCSVSAAAQTPTQTPPADPTAPRAPAETEQTLINVPTTQPLKRHGTYFRLTHRFSRDLRRGTFGQLAEDLFSLDNGAVIGVEYRFAPFANVQIGAHRSMLFKAIQIAGRYDAWRQGDSAPASISLVASVEGDDNLSEHHQPALGAALSRTIGGAVVLYASPMFVWNTPAFGTGHEEHEHEHEDPLAVPATPPEHDNTLFVGLGGRFRLRPSVYIVAEIAPRLAGHDPDRASWGVGLEKHTRGHRHVFQINVTNSFGTTYGQLARGGDRHNVYLGFNLARTF